MKDEIDKFFETATYDALDHLYESTSEFSKIDFPIRELADQGGGKRWTVKLFGRRFFLFLKFPFIK